MTKLQRFIALEWLRFFLGSLFAFLLLISVGNLISGLLRTNVTAYEVIINHLIELPGNSTKIFPVSCMTGTLFCINKLQSRNELVAIFASGFSRVKFVSTIVFLSLVVSAAQIYCSGYLSPYVKSKKSVLLKGSESKFGNLNSASIKSSTIGSGKIWYKSDSYFYSFTHYDKTSKSLIDLSVYQHDLNYLLENKSNTSKVTFSASQNKWISNEQRLITGLNHTDFPKITHADSQEVNINEKPEDFNKLDADINSLNLLSLYRYLSNVKKSGINIDQYLVTFYDKINAAVSCILLSIFALVSIFKPNRRQSSFGKTMSFVFIFTLLFWLLNSYFQELGNSSKLNPLIACFMVSVIFATYLFYVYFKNRKLT